MGHLGAGPEQLILTLGSCPAQWPRRLPQAHSPWVSSWPPVGWACRAAGGCGAGSWPLLGPFSTTVPCECVHTCVIDGLQGRPQLGWEMAEFLLSVALRKWWLINSISPEVLWFHMRYQWETEKSPQARVWVPPPHWLVVASSLWRPLRFRLWLPSGRGPASPSTRFWGRRMSSSGKRMGPLWCLGHRTLVTDEEGPCAAWMSPVG